jgi:hypothetical protein
MGFDTARFSKLKILAIHEAKHAYPDEPPQLLS